MQFVFPDNTVLINFSVISRIDLLIQLLDGKGRWTEAVQAEVRQGLLRNPGFSELLSSRALGDAIRVDRLDEMREIARIRRQRFGGTDLRPSQHLGEAMTCYLLANRPELRDSCWVSDDLDALQCAKEFGVETMNTPGLLDYGVHRKHLDIASAETLLRSMQDQGRLQVKKGQNMRVITLSAYEQGILRG